MARQTAMAPETTEPLLLTPLQQQRRQRQPGYRAWGIAAAVVLVLLLLAASGPLRPRLFDSPPELVELTLLAGAAEKGAVCLDGTPPGYHLQKGSGSGSRSWLIHLEISTTGTKSTYGIATGRRFLGTQKVRRRMEAHFTSEDCASMRRLLMNSWKKDSSMLHRPSLQVVLLVVLPRYCIAMILVEDFLKTFQLNALLMLGFFLTYISGERSFWSVYDGVVHLQNVREVLPKDCLANKQPTEIRHVLVPGSSAPDKSWLSCKNNIRNCNSTQIEFLDGFMNTMVNYLKVVQDNEDWGMFIDSCFTHCQTLYAASWNSPISPRLGNKNIAETVGDWHSGRSHGVKEIDCEYPCNPTCSSLLPT